MVERARDVDGPADRIDAELPGGLLEVDGECAGLVGGGGDGGVGVGAKRSDVGERNQLA
ncbi:MAG: hypothetical protein IPK26_26295 [Planctomycetes bacterium]|nr:hypothetical protein [Planctomycetota bacterium]